MHYRYFFALLPKLPSCRRVVRIIWHVLIEFVLKFAPGESSISAYRVMSCLARHTKIYVPALSEISATALVNVFRLPQAYLS